MSNRYVRNIIIFTCIFIVLGEFLFRKRYAEQFRSPTKIVMAIQELLVLDDLLGFHWKENVDASEGILFIDQDSETWPLSTDNHGFINPPNVLEKKKIDEPIQIVGIGDSFMEHAAYYVTDYFSARGLNYYNLAIHRQSPPQYLDIVRTYVNPINPKVVLLGITENDMNEIDDYLSWRESGLDWFTFHSGTWCGPPLRSTPLLRTWDNMFPGYNSFFTLLENKAPALTKLRTKEVKNDNAELTYWLELIQNETIENKQNLIVLFIPSKESVMIERTAENLAFERAIAYCQENNIRYIDLHPIFREHENPPSLYYPINGHWNGDGIKVALEKVAVLNPDLLPGSKD